jgi:NDP-sugar pyrophosphorylase family protein
MHYIDYGLGVFHRTAFDGVPQKGAYDLADIYQELIQKGELAGHEVDQRFYETGSFAGIEELSQLLAKDKANRT